MTKYYQSIDRLLAIMNELREQCPWDQKQTIHTLRSQTIEELYELIDAIDKEDWTNIKEELGDLLLHIVFYSKIASEENHFDFNNVINNICDKLVNRHPHIYGDTQVNNEEDVKRNWEKIKQKEGEKSVLSGIPSSLPSLQKAISIQRKVRQVGFDWDNKEQVMDKVKEELMELNEALENKNIEEIENEFGDVLFSMINYARFINVDPEHCLEKTNQKFIKRFQKMESMNPSNMDMTQMNLEELNKLWEAAKKTDERKS